MKKELKTILLCVSIALILFFISLYAQGQSYVQNCPQYPVSDYWDANCFIKTAEPFGEIRLPQGGVMGLNHENPMWISIPTNRPEWAIGIAHAWNLHRNMIQKVDFPRISYYMAITGHETGMACDCNAQFSAGHIPWSRSGNPPGPTNNFPQKCGPAARSEDGCFQMEFLNGWGELNQIMPHRFPCDGFERVVSGRSNVYKSVGTQVLAMTYRNIAYSLLMEYSWQMDPWSVFGAAGCDQYAYEKFLAASWNGSISGTFGTLTQPYPTRAGSTRPGVNLVNDRAGARANNNWDLDATAANYPEVIAWGMAAIEGNTAYPGYIYRPSLYWGGSPGVDVNLVNNALPAQQNHVQLGYYNGAITWTNVEQYIDTLTNFYFEYKSDPVALQEIKDRVQNVFIAVSGSIATPINFRQLGPVVDEIILSFPKENPLVQVLQLDGLPHGAAGNGPSTCGNGVNNSLGQFSPASHIVSRNIQTATMCIGQKLILAGEVVGGEEPNMTYRWYNNGSLVSTGVNDSLYIFTAATIGNYEFKLNVCNQAGGCSDAGCTYRITVNNCNSCGLIATGTPTNTPCRNAATGSISLNISGSTNYTVQYSGRTSGTRTGSSGTMVLNNLLDGIYNITVRDNTSPSCVYTLSVTVGYTVNRNDVVRIFSTQNGCGVNLRAEISSLNCQCDYTVNAVAFPGANQWERFITMKITPSNGRFEMFRANTFGTPGVLSRKFQLCTGDSIKGELQIIPASGSCDPNRVPSPANVQTSTYDVWVVNAAGVEVYRQRFGPGSVTQGTDRLMFNIPVICPSTQAGYNFSWNPTGSTNPNITVYDPNLSTTYTVTATLQSNAACVLQDSKFVPSICTPLPVEFIMIDATRQTHGVVVVNWDAMEDSDRSNYYIERSDDPEKGFTVIGSVPASKGPYEFYDPTAATGRIIYYRVYKRNEDGQLVYSKIVSVFPAELSYGVWPNPFTKETTFYSNVKGKFSLELYNLLGNTVETHLLENIESQEIGNNLANGIYFLKVIAENGEMSTLKIVKE